MVTTRFWWPTQLTALPVPKVRLHGVLQHRTSTHWYFEPIHDHHITCWHLWQRFKLLFRHHRSTWRDFLTVWSFDRPRKKQNEPEPGDEGFFYRST